MFCPKCKSEYRQGFHRCADCDVDLVHELPVEPVHEPEYEEYEELLSTHSPQDIALLKSLLESEGIRYYFQGEYISHVLHMSIPIRLMVAKSQVKTAVEVVRDLKLSFVARNVSDRTEDK